MRKILIADSNFNSRKAMVLLLNNRIPEARLLEASDLNELDTLVKNQNPDVILMDDSLWEAQNGSFQFNSVVCRCCLVLMSVDDNRIEIARSIGAGFIHKGAPPDRIASIIHQIYDQNRHLSKNTESD
jgi:DNA-binding NarL/FixJ family response regulator